MKINNKGEIATILTVVTLGLMLVGTAVGTKLAERSTEQRTQARGFGELKTQGLSGCQIVDTDQGPGCWCSDGGWQGHCFAGGKRGDKPSQLCKDNCSLKNGGTVENNTTPGPTNAAGETGMPSGENCSLSSASLSPAVGNKCGNCVVSKSGGLQADGLRKAFDNWGFSACNNNQIVSYWCNGAVSEEGKNTCRARLTECKATAADCTGAPGADAYPLPGTAGTPAPTAPPGGSPGGPGGGRPKATATPDPDGTWGNFVVISKESEILAINKFVTDYKLGISSGSYPVGYLPDEGNHLKEDKTFFSKLIESSVTQAGHIYKPEKEIVQEVGGRTKDAELTGSALISGDSTIYDYSNQTFKFCNPYSKNYAEKDLVPTITMTDLLGKCKDKMNILNLDFDNKPNPISTPILSATYAYYLFTLRLKDQTSLPQLIRNIKAKIPTNITGFYTSSGTTPSNDVNYSHEELTFQLNTESGSGFGKEYITPEDEPFIFRSLSTALPENQISGYPVIETLEIDNIPNILVEHIQTTIQPCPTTEVAIIKIIAACKDKIKEQIIYLENKPLTTPTSTPDTSLTPGAGTPPAAPTTAPPQKKLELQFTNVWQADWANSDEIEEYDAKISTISIKVDGANDNCDKQIRIDLETNGKTDSCSTNLLYNTNSTIVRTLVIKSIVDIMDTSGFDHVQTSCNLDFNGDFVSVPEDPINFNINIFSSNVNEDGNITCSVDNPSNPHLTTKSLTGSTNEAFRNAMDKWVKGELNVLQMSSFISQLTRAPGLQISFCDPRKGECNPTF